MRALVVGDDYFAKRYVYLLMKMGIESRRKNSLPKKLDYDAAFFSGMQCNSQNIMRSLENGLSVFSEQMIVMDEKDILTVDYAKDMGLKLIMGSFDIYNPIIQQSRELIRKEKSCDIFLYRIGPAGYSRLNIVDDFILHDIGIAYNLLGQHRACTIISVSSRETNCLLHCRIGSGNVIIYANNSLRYKERKVDILGEKIRIKGNLLSQELHTLNVDEKYIPLFEAGFENFREYYVKKCEPLEKLIWDFFNKKGNAVSYEILRVILETVLKIKRIINQ